MLTNPTDDVIERAQRALVGWVGEPPIVAELIAALRASRARVAKLEGVVAAVVDIHSPNHDPDGWQFCNECKADYQCRTARAMDAALSAEDGRVKGGE